MPTAACISESSPLSVAEAKSLADHEAAIAKGLTAFMEVGAALLDIRDGKLYRQTHDTFENYCRERWNIDRTYAHRLITAREIGEDLLPIGNKQPTRESQVRPLAALPKADRAPAWKEAVEKTGGKPTAKAVQEVVDRRQGKTVPFTPPAHAVVTEVDGDTVETIAEEQEERRAIEEDQSPEDWAATMPVYAQLPDGTRKRFVASATLYRTLEKHRDTFAYHAKRVMSGSRLSKGYAWHVRRFLKVESPKKWVRCPAPDKGGCGGNGQIAIGECPMCHGEGFLIL